MNHFLVQLSKTAQDLTNILQSTPGAAPCGATRALATRRDRVINPRFARMKMSGVSEGHAFWWQRIFPPKSSKVNENNRHVSEFSHYQSVSGIKNLIVQSVNVANVLPLRIRFLRFFAELNFQSAVSKWSLLKMLLKTTIRLWVKGRQKKLPYFFFSACGVKETEKCEYSIQSNSYFILFFLSL